MASVGSSSATATAASAKSLFMVASYPSAMAFDLVLFGCTGDLTWGKLMPALFQAWRHGKLPEGGRIVAVSRQDMSDDAYRAWVQERFHDVEDAKRPSDD